jgi:hypothetical protein
MTLRAINAKRPGRAARAATVLALSLWAAALQPAAAQAAPGGFALVIGEELYNGAPRHTSCGQTAHDVANRLRQAGVVTEALTNPTSVALRDGLDNFAAQLSGAPSGTTLIYVCSTALADHERLFLLPSDVALDQPVQPETQGVVVQALLNTLAGTGGTLFADLELLKDGRVESGAALLRDRLPPGLHLAISAGQDSHVGALGEAISGGRIGVGAETNWNEMVVGIGALPHSAGTLLTLPARGAPQPQAPLAPAGQAAGPPAAARPPAPAQAIAPAPAPTETRARRGAVPVASVQAAPLPGSPPLPAAAQTPGQAKPPAPSSFGPAPSGLASAQAAAYPGQPPREAPRPFARSDRVARLQSAMIGQGIYTGPVDGVMNERTRSGIRAWQGRLGDPRTGTLTQMEVVRLLNGGGAP